MLKYFNKVYGAPHSKTSHIKKIKKNNEKCVFIGDSHDDFKAAKVTNIKFIMKINSENFYFRKKTKTTTAELDRDQEFRAPRIPKTQTETEPPKPPKPPIPPIVGTAVGDGGDRPKKTDAFSSIRKFAKKNPQIAAAGALAGYDIGKGILSKIMKLRAPSVQGGRAIQVSAKQ